MADFRSFVTSLLWHVVMPLRYTSRRGTWHTPELPFLLFKVAAPSNSLRCKSPEIAATYTTFLSIAAPYITARPTNSLTSFPRYCILRNFEATQRNIPRPSAFVRISIIIVKWTISWDWPRLPDAYLLQNFGHRI